MMKASTGVAERVIDRLAFSIRIARQDEEWSAAIRARQAAYGRHLPEFADGLAEREEMDSRPDTDVLVALSRLDSGPLGTMRVHLNGRQPLPLEQSVKLPASLKAARLIEATRFAIPANASGSVVTNAFFKAFFLYAEGKGADFMVITARRPVDRMYERLLFKDVDPEAGYIPMKHVGNLPHRVLFLPVKTLQAVWGEVSHPLYRYFFETVHPDIEVTEDKVIADEEFA